MNNHLKLPDSFMEKYRERDEKTPEQKAGILRYKEKIEVVNYGKKPVANVYRK